jgi:hypothetical protein
MACNLAEASAASPTPKSWDQKNVREYMNRAPPRQARRNMTVR